MSLTPHVELTPGLVLRLVLFLRNMSCVFMTGHGICMSMGMEKEEREQKCS